MFRTSQLKLIKIGAGLGLLFLLVALTANMQVAAWFIACGVLGYLNIFGVLHSGISRYKGQAVGYSSLLISLAALLGDALAVFYGYGVVIALATGCFLVIDALVLRFQGLPLGVSSREP